MNTDKLLDLILEALGQASLCWSETPTGVFESEKATGIASVLLVDIMKLIQSPEEQTLLSYHQEKILARDENIVTFALQESFLQAYLKYIEALKIESPDKHFALEIAIDPTRKHVVPAIGIIEVNEEKEGNAL